jgi:hypothetical protein
MRRKLQRKMMAKTDRLRQDLCITVMLPESSKPK